MLERFTATARLALAAAEGERPAAAARAVRRPRLVVGLGNPGAQYGNTRHNVGAWCVALIAKRHRTQLDRAGRVDRATVQRDGEALHLARPRAMVNESGPPVRAELERLQLAVTDLLVVYDDLDLPVGQLRLRERGGHGGHNGLRSLIGALGSGEFARLRVGIDRPYDSGRPVRDPDRIADWVLSVPGREERASLDAAVALAAEAIELAARDGLDRAMNRYNPPRG